MYTHEQRSLVDYNQWSHKNQTWLSDKTTTTMPMENTLGTSSADALRIKNEAQRDSAEQMLLNQDTILDKWIIGNSGKLNI